MKSASSALKTFLASTDTLVKADLYTFTLSGGSVLRYTGADRDITVSGLTFKALAIADGGVKASCGIQVDKLEVTVFADSSDTVNGVPFIQYVIGNGFDGAVMKAERAFAIDWPTMFLSGPVGTYTRFYGRFSEAQDAGASGVRLSIASWLELLDAQMPPDLYQGSCLHTVFDSGCALVKASYTATSSVSAGTRTTTAFPTALVAAAGYYNLGVITFTSGANSGLSRTIKSQDVSGNLALVLPLPAAPAAGDAFTVTPGCDQSKGTCQAKFNNLVHFHGYPFIPVPETAI